MKIKIFFLFIISVMIINYTELKAQDSLISSIGYERSIDDSKYGTRYKIDSVGYPSDLPITSLFFIEIGASETYGNTGFTIPSYKKLNQNIKEVFAKKYPYKFEILSNENRFKDPKFFLLQGLRYRLLISTTFTSVRYSNGDRDWKQLFSVAIQDLANGKIYGCNDFFWYNKYIPTFIKSLKK